MFIIHDTVYMTVARQGFWSGVQEGWDLAGWVSLPSGKGYGDGSCPSQFFDFLDQNGAFQWRN